MRLLPIFLLLFPACSSVTAYEDESAGFFGRYRRGHFQAASRVLQQEHKDEWKVRFNAAKDQMRYPDSAVLWNLERGKVLLAAGKFSDAFLAFEVAETIINQDFQERAILSSRDALAEVEASLVNAKAMPYEGTVCDRIYINVHKSLAAALGQDLESALVECRRAEEVQEEAIRQWRGEVQKRGGSKKRFAQDPELRNTFPELAEAESLPPAYRDFANPWATLVRGVLRRIRNRAGEDGVLEFRNLTSMLPNNQPVQDELRRALDGETAAGLVYVLFENGLAPGLQSRETMIRRGWLRALGKENPDSLYAFENTFLALPAPTRARPAADFLRISASGSSSASPTALISDQGTVQKFEFSQRFPSILLRELARVVAQETLTHTVREIAEGVDNEKDDSPGGWEILATLGGLVYKGVVNQADDRSWRTLAADYQFAVVPIPADRRLQLSLAGGNARSEVNLPSGETVLLVVRSVRHNHISWHAVGFGEDPTLAALPAGWQRDENGRPWKVEFADERAQAALKMGTVGFGQTSGLPTAWAMVQNQSARPYSLKARARWQDRYGVGIPSPGDHFALRTVAPGESITLENIAPSPRAERLLLTLATSR